MRQKLRTTSTINPLHFEDLEPHRFEDLVRQLIYDFRDWHTIEATGRGGSDQGMDIRAWERSLVSTNMGHNEVEGEHSIEGNLWVVQCKREAQLGPARVKKTISEFSPESEVYGYILVAPANFSRKSYDVFREEIRKKGVTECYLWGRSELEDMLMMPKNDHILFTFFGISLSVRRRTRTSEVKYRVNNKNKLFKVLGDNCSRGEIPEPILLRDVNDDYYPFIDEYGDFKERPRWEEVVAFECHPQGLLVHIHRFYACFDPETKEYDFASEVDLLARTARFDEQPDSDFREKQDRIEDYWKHLPRRLQAHCEVNGIIPWEEILLIDEKGDGIYECPHIYVEGCGETTLVAHNWRTIDLRQKKCKVENEFKRIESFPKKFPRTRKLKLSKGIQISLDEDTQRLFTHGYASVGTLYDVDQKYKLLKVRHVVQVSDVLIRNEPLYLEITHRFLTTVKEFLGEEQDSSQKSHIERQVGRHVSDNDELHVLECQRICEWQLKN